MEKIPSFQDLTLDTETIAGLREEGVERLMADHWSEIAVDQDVIHLDPDWERYELLERAKSLIFLGLRRSTELIGYASFQIHRHLHYRRSLFAFNDLIYVRPADRGIAGLYLILGCEHLLRQLQVQKATFHVKPEAGLRSPVAGDSLSQLEEMLELEEVFGIELQDGITSDSSDLSLLLEQLGYRHQENSYGKLL